MGMKQWKLLQTEIPPWKKQKMKRKRKRRKRTKKRRMRQLTRLWMSLRIAKRPERKRRKRKRRRNTRARGNEIGHNESANKHIYIQISKRWTKQLAMALTNKLVRHPL